MTEQFSFSSPFSIKEAIFHGGRLTVLIDGRDERIEFDFVRSVFAFKESDLWEDAEKYEVEPLFSVKGEPGLGVFQINKNPLSERIFCGRLAGEQPSYFWISTPDECVEVVSFSKPIISTV